ncbi:MAG TPA: TIGR04076 family protein [bacterium]|nr:TIGR04076 family protein [bacterium]
MDLKIEVVEIKGQCPVFKIGDEFILKDGYKLISEIPVCMHSLSAILPYYNAFRISKPEQWGLSKKSDPDKGYIQCSDPVDFTDGGTVTFEIRKNE